MQSLIIVLLGISTQVFAVGADLSPNGDCDQHIYHTHYKLCYSDSHRQALWTFHKLTKNSIAGTTRRTNDYRYDPKVHSPVDNNDYRGSGFDRGHLVPAADMKLNYRSMSETFFMSNMSPQVAGFNRGIWKNLEDSIRKQVKILGDAYVVTGPILTHDLKKISSGVSVPTKFYKIAYFKKAEIMRAYIFENKSYRGRSYTEFQTTVDYIERVTGIDFYHRLSSRIQKKMEAEKI